MPVTTSHLTMCDRPFNPTAEQLGQAAIRHYYMAFVVGILPTRLPSLPASPVNALLSSDVQIIISKVHQEDPKQWFLRVLRAK